MENNYIEYIASTASRMFTHEVEKVSIEDVVKQHNKKWYANLGESDMAEVIKNIQEDSLLSDYELVDNYIQRKVYEPFTCLFETTGRVVIENDLREFFGDDDDDDDFDINTTNGIIETMVFYAKNKMLHGFVGNSCPRIYLNKDLGIIHIGCDSDDHGEDILPEGFECVTSVCTDLWWYSIIDVEELKRLDPDFDENNYNIVDIPAGTWELSHKYGISEKGYHENLPYATLRKVK